jgi:hypothetical protein
MTRANLAAAFGAVVLVAILFRGPGRLRNLAVIAPPAVAAILAVFVAVGAIGGGLVPDTRGPQVPTPSASPAVRPSSTPPPTVGEVVGGLGDPFSDRNLRFRFAFWAEFAGYIAQRPLVGYGTGAAADGFDHFYEGTGRQNFEPHSIYFKAALELGLGGLLLMLAILATAGWLALRVARRGELVGLVGVGIVVMFVVAGLTGPMLDAYPANLLFWATLGWCARRTAEPAT